LAKIFAYLRKKKSIFIQNIKPKPMEKRMSTNNKLKKIFLKSLVVLLNFVIILLFYFCKKDTQRETKSGGNTFSLIKSLARLNNSYGGISYNSTTKMLEFNSLSTLHETISKLKDEMNVFQYDNGNTLSLLSAINTVTNEAVLRDSLMNNTPLSDTVMTTFLHSGVSEGTLFSIVSSNLDLTSEAVDYFYSLNINNARKSNLIDSIVSRVPFSPGLTDFEGLFEGYQSYRMKILNEQGAFLLSGGDPESTSNPIHLSILEGIEASLYNANLEVKIGSEIVKLAPHLNILIKDGSLIVLDYIRTNGTVPFYTPSGSEPSNGYEKVDAPMPVDENILVKATDYFNYDDGGLVFSIIPMTNIHSYSFNSNVTGVGYKFYWEFSDGKVSYLANPTHTFSGCDNINATLSIFDSNGAIVSTNHGNVIQGKTCDCPLNASYVANQYIGTMIKTSTGISDWEYDPNSPTTYNYNIEWGDGSADDSGTWTTLGNKDIYHSYSSFGTFTTKLSISYLRTSNNSQACLTEREAIVRVIDPNQEVCCSKNDKEKEKWKNPTGTVKYRHMFKLRNNIATKGKIDNEIQTYHKLFRIFGGAVWMPINANACLSINGSFFAPGNNPSSSEACEGSAKPISWPYDCGTYYSHNMAYHNSSAYIWLSFEQVEGKVKAWNQESTIKLNDGCN
jgi:hypothetical protein